MTRTWFLRVGLLLMSAGWFACTDSVVDPPGESEPDLDAQLEALVTFGGQRGLDNFLLPDSNALQSIPQDPQNPLTPDKVALGKLLFHETALGTGALRAEGVGTYACATCHHAGAGFQAGTLQGLGDGGSGWGVNGSGRTVSAAYAAAEVDAQMIRTPSVLNSAYQEIMGWDGMFGARGPNVGTEARWVAGTEAEVNQLGFDGLESQAIAALRIHRMDDVASSVVASHPTYQALFSRAFPGAEVTSREVGLAIAAYERTLLANKAPFQRWLRGERTAMTDAEKRGGIVFFGNGKCEVCHTGPALNQVAFYALGMPDMETTDALGDDASPSGRGGFTGKLEEEHKYKVPQLYNLVDSPFYGHGATFHSLAEVVAYYNDAIPAVSLPDGRLAIFFKPLHLTDLEMEDLVQFLSSGLRDPDLDRYVPGELPSGNCTPANDPAARSDLGC